MSLEQAEQMVCKLDRMLQIRSQNADFVQDGDVPIAFSANEFLKEIAAFLRRHRSVIATFAGLGLFAGLTYFLLSTPTYTALSDLILDARKTSAGQPQTILGDPIS